MVGKPQTITSILMLMAFWGVQAIAFSTAPEEF